MIRLSFAERRELRQLRRTVDELAEERDEWKELALDRVSEVARLRVELRDARQGCRR